MKQKIKLFTLKNGYQYANNIHNIIIKRRNIMAKKIPVSDFISDKKLDKIKKIIDKSSNVEDANCRRFSWYRG